MSTLRPRDSSPSRSIHGRTYEDPFHWVSSADESGIISLIDEENRRLMESTAHLDELRRNLENEFRASTPKTVTDLPVRRGDWWYYGQIEEGHQYPRLMRIRARVAHESPPDPLEPPSQPQAVLDFNRLAPNGNYLAMGGFDFNEAADMIAYAIDVTGEENYALSLRELPSGRTRNNELVGIGPGPVLSPDGSRVYYSTRDENWRCYSIWVHDIGASQSTDRMLYFEEDTRFHLTARRSRDGRHLIIHSESRTTTEEMHLDLVKYEPTINTIWPRREGVKYTSERITINGTPRLLVLHDTDKREGHYILTDVDPEIPSQAKDWHAVLEPMPGTQLIGIEAFADVIVLSFKAKTQDRIAVIRLGPLNCVSGAQATSMTLSKWAKAAGYTELQEIEFSNPLVHAHCLANQPWNQSTIRLQARSYARPPTYVEYNPETRTLVTLRSHLVPSHGAFDQYEQEQIWANARDGTRVPISLVWNRDSVGEGPAPLVLYAYGAYGLSVHASFETTRLSLLDRGVVCAIAHVRGGGELGASWHAGGRLFTKMNTFTDLIDCARELVARGRTEPKRILIEGGSAGGLTVGAAANLAPELFAGVIAEVPFVDPLNTLLEEDAPLTVTEWDEWGNPLESPDAFDYIRSYSPYENIPTVSDYPRVLALTSRFDTRVAFSEAAKWVLRLRSVGADAYLSVEKNGGHTRITGRDSAYASTALVYAWLLDTLRVECEPVLPASATGSMGNES